MGMRGARRGASSEWVRYLRGNQPIRTPSFRDDRYKNSQRVCSGGFVPIDGVLVQLSELPVDGEDVHVVVLLEVAGQQVQRVLAGPQPLLVLVDLLHLKGGTGVLSNPQLHVLHLIKCQTVWILVFFFYYLPFYL